MKIKQYTLCYILLFLNLSIIKGQSETKYPSGIEHVIVIGLDGTSPDGIRSSKSANMQQLIQEGSVKWNVRTVLPSSSSPNWASMIMGAGTEAHGIIDNDWGRADYTLPPIVKNEDGIFPTIFGWVRKYRANAEIGAVYQWGGFGRLFEKSALNFDKNMPNENTTTSEFCKYIIAKKPVLGFMHLDLVDDIGHEFGHGTSAYYASISKVDSLIGLVLQSIKIAGIDKQTLVIITADHGGVGYGHGGATLEEAEITMILNGASIKNGYTIQQQVYTYDLAATIAFALQIVPPYAWTGRPIKSAFIQFDEPENLYLGKTLIANPKIFPWKYLYEEAGGLYQDSIAIVSMQTMAANAKTYYTTDGSIPTFSSQLYESPFKLDTTAVITAISFDKNGNGSVPVKAYFRFVSTKQNQGVKVQYFSGENLGWNHMPVFQSLQSSHKWYTYEFELNRETVSSKLSHGNTTFGCILESNIQIDESGLFTFYLRSDDGSKLYIDDKEIVNNDGDHGVIEKNGTVQLKIGLHKIKVEYYNGSGGYWLNLFYKGPGIPKQIVPANKLIR
jgi:hypothetical protein